MTTLARCGNHLEAAKIAEEIAALPEDGGSQVDVACCFSQCAAVVEYLQTSLSAEDRKLHAEYVVRAMKALKLAVQQGYRNVIYLETEPDLDPIRKNAEFKVLLEGMKGGP